MTEGNTIQGKSKIAHKFICFALRVILCSTSSNAYLIHSRPRPRRWGTEDGIQPLRYDTSEDVTTGQILGHL